jgi:peptidoglycan/xylan/chitin deacetylase (PgdA/CDA1 family)
MKKRRLIRGISKRIKFKLSKKTIWILSLIVFVLLIFSFCAKISVVNSLGESVKADFDVYIGNFQLSSSRTDEVSRFIFLIGKYSIKVSAEGYEDTVITVRNFNPLQKVFNAKVELDIDYINVNSFEVFDPNGLVKLSPFVSIKGVNVLGEKIELEGLKEFPYGNYNATLYDAHFLKNIEIKGDKIYGEEDSLRLDPGKGTVRISEDDVVYVENFVKDYLEYSSLDYINISKGFPQQFYLYNSDMVISLGDMVFLICEKRLFDENAVYFVPLDKKYSVVENVFSFEECYANGLLGYVPSAIDGSKVSSILGDYNYELNDVNSKQRKLPISFSFDIESGRYVHADNKGTLSISSCKNDNFKLGLVDDLNCNNPDKVAWFTPVIEPKYDEFSYPWVSGLKGFEKILDYSSYYGVPLTLFIVDRDLRAFEELSPGIIKRTQELVDNGMIEIASHTSSHNNLEVLDETSAIKIFKESKEFLSKKFDTDVVGFRGPYLSLVSGNVLLHEKALAEASFSYYSQEYYEEKAFPYVYSKPLTYLLLTHSSPLELVNQMENRSYIVTINHPWNYYYDVDLIEGEYYLREKEENVIKANAMVLLSLSQGAIPIQLKDLEVK